MGRRRNMRKHDACQQTYKDPAEEDLKKKKADLLML